MLKFKNGEENFRGKESPETLSLLIAGDCCPREECENLILDGHSKDIVADLKPLLEDCDISMVQLESPMSRRGKAIRKSGPNIIVDPACIEFINECGFDIAALANNHIGDYGFEPVMDTIELLKKNNISYVGAGENLEDAGKPLFIEKKGLKIAFLNYAENEFGGATLDSPGASTLDPLVNISQIRKNAMEADVLIVIIHGGNEHNPVPSPGMKKICRAFVEAGASALINIHTHCPQGIELWQNSPIVYCPGNFYFDFFDNDEFHNNMWSIGYMVKLNIDKKGIFSLSVHPYRIEDDCSKITLLKGERKESFNSYLSKISTIIKDEQKAKKMYDAWTAVYSKWQFEKLGDFIDESTFDKKPEDVPSSPAAKNLLSCESHNELITNMLRVYLSGKLKDAEKLLPELQALRCPKTQNLL